MHILKIKISANYNLTRPKINIFQIAKQAVLPKTSRSATATNKKNYYSQNQFYRDHNGQQQIVP